MGRQSVSTILKKNYQQNVQAGYAVMREHRVVICTTVRDCAEPLQRNLPFVEKLRDCFAKSHVVVIENDSVDRTKELLAEWQQQQPGVILLGKDTGKVTIPTAKTSAENPFFSYSRIQKMTGFRNQYLEHIESMDEAPDTMIVMDLDCHAFFLDGIAHSFGQSQQWDMLAANGRHFRSSGESIYFDTYAMREKGMDCPQTEQEIYAAQVSLAPLTRYMPLFAVDSAFGGLGLYRYAAVKGLRYYCLPNDNPQVTVLCDHPSLHHDMRAAGNDRIFINPNMVVHYNRPRGMRRALPVGSVPFT